MVNATIDNPPVSVILGQGESVSVPTGEVWNVTITVFDSERIRINGTVVASTNSDASVDTMDVVLTAGDSVKLDSQATLTNGTHISGWVVN